MTASLEISDAVAEFKKIKPEGWTVDHKADKPIYSLVKIAEWPYVVHYEFRFNKKSGLFAELHVEHKDYSWLGKTLSSCADRVSMIDGYQLVYSPEQNSPISGQKRWPSLSIALGHYVPGTISASIMRVLIGATRPEITSAIGNWSKR